LSSSGIIIEAYIAGGPFIRALFPALVGVSSFLLGKNLEAVIS
jgi:hypothetical protein